MSSDKSEEEEHEAVSRQIVDYYRKYSLNKHLPKYFSGSSLFYMPPIVREEDIVPISQPIATVEGTSRGTLLQTQAGLLPSEDLLEPKVISPASSVTSNRKLEWDNGADIGYSNTKLYKSHSLPILLVDKNSDKSTSTKLSTKIVTVISYPSGDDDVDDKQILSSSSSTSYQQEAPITSSSSSGNLNVKPISTSSSSFTSTLAYLKSKIGTPDAKSTPKLPAGVTMYADTPFVPKTQKGKIAKKSRIISLCSTKPIVVECFDHQIKKSSDKKIQTTFTEGFSHKCVQTSASLEIITKDHKSKPKPIENQSVIHITYDSASDKRTCSSNVQTDVDIATPCDSFEYYRQEKQNIDSTDSSKEIPLLGQLIAEKQSKSLIGDVDRSIELLHKLLKSKKYDQATKKHYMKKIVAKIVDSKYIEDSTTSSELFVPKKQNEQSKKNEVKQRPQFSKFTIKTFRDEFLPTNAQPEEEHSGAVTEHSSAVTEHSGAVTDLTKSASEKQSVSSNSYQSWKDDKTKSERLLEEKQKGQGDHLVNFAKKERQHQIEWINDEISHLTQLKGLLEKKIQTTTTVYMVSQHSGKSKNSSDSSKSQENGRNYVIQTELSNSSSASGVPKEYNLYDKTGKRCYCVGQFSKEGECGGDDKVVGDIEVVSDDRTTNIKVTTKKLCKNKVEVFQPKPPALIGPGKYDTFPKSKAEERYGPCGKQQSSRQSSGSYTFEVPLNCTIANKVREIVDKYTKPGVDKFSKCECICACPEPSRNTELACTNCCKCKRSSKRESQKTDSSTQDGKKVDDAICQTKPCGCRQKQVQTTHCTNNSTCFCQKCRNSTQTNNAQKKACGCDQQVQTSMCTKDAKCWRCQGGANKTENAKCQTIVCAYNEQVQTSMCTKNAKCYCQRCKGSTNKKENAKCQTVACGCDEQVQTSMCTNDKNCRCWRCRDKKGKLENAKCQTKVCSCDQQSQTTDRNECRCQDSENAQCQTRICQCTEQVQTSIPTRDAMCCCKNSEMEEAKCQTNICDCEQRQTQTNKSSKEANSCQAAVCLCEEEIQTSILTKDCGCNSKESNGRETKTQTDVGESDEKQVQTKVCTKDECCSCCLCDQSTNTDEKQSVKSDVESVSSSAESANISDSLRSCSCCKRKNLKQKYLECLRDNLTNQAYPLCRPCYRQNQMGMYPMNYCYTNPTHVCSCYTVVQTETLNEIKKTITDLQVWEDFCTCMNADRSNISEYCKYCQGKLKKTARNRNGIAYTLTFEDASIRKDEKHKTPRLEEIKVKIPVVVQRKKNKDKENKRKKQYYDSEDTSSSGANRSKRSTLQDYLNQNRPDFVYDAEGRRQTVNEVRTQRQEMSDYNKLKFLQKCQEEYEKNAKRLFSDKEMKKITQRNYRKLPEVQKKLNDNRSKQLRQASRLMADTFNKKLRENVLKGKRNLPINVQVVTM